MHSKQTNRVLNLKTRLEEFTVWKLWIIGPKKSQMTEIKINLNDLNDKNWFQSLFAINLINELIILLKIKF